MVHCNMILGKRARFRVANSRALRGKRAKLVERSKTGGDAVSTQPNILLIQADQLSANALAAYGNKTTITPHIDRLAETGVVFRNAHSPFPLCAPSRVGMLTGRIPSRVGGFDNAAEFRSETPTFAHYLRVRGYRTCLTGKMHYVGADQLHGFEDRLTSDIYPGDFYWTETKATRTDKAKSDSRGVTDAGVCRRSVQMDFDELTMFRARQWLYDVAKDRQHGNAQPFMMTVSLTHPHDPYYCSPEHWARYDGVEIPMPTVPRVPVADQDPLLAYCMERHGLNMDFDDDVLLRARRAYFGSVSYFDDQVGLLTGLLDELGLAENTVVIVTSDHGEMLGERGMWYKRHFYQSSVAVPLIVSAPSQFAAGRRDQNVSLIDLLPTFLGLAGDADLSSLVEQIEGRSLLPLLESGTADWDDRALSEVMSDGLENPVFMVRRGARKLIIGPDQPAQLFDPEADPWETEDLAARPEEADTLAALSADAAEVWDAAGLQAEIDLSVARRLLIRDAHGQGKAPDWDFPSDPSDEGRWCRSNSDYNDWCFDVLKAR